MFFIVAHNSLITDDSGEPLAFSSADEAQSKMIELSQEWPAEMYVVTEEEWDSRRD